MNLHGHVCILCKHEGHDHVVTMTGIRCIALTCGCRFFALEICHLCQLPIPLKAMKKSPLRRTKDHLIAATKLPDGTTTPKGEETRPAHQICNGVRGNADLATYILPEEIKGRVSRLLWHQHPDIRPWIPCNDEACRV